MPRSEAAVPPTCRSMKYISPSSPRNRRWIPSRSKKEKKRMLQKRGTERSWKKKDDDGREEEKELRWLIDRVRVWEVGRDSQVQSQRTREPGLACPLDRGEWWHRVSLSGFSYARWFAWKRETGTMRRDMELVLNRSWPSYKFKFPKYMPKYYKMLGR